MNKPKPPKRVPAVMKLRDAEELFKSLGGSVEGDLVRCNGRTAKLPRSKDVAANWLRGMFRTLEINK